MQGGSFFKRSERGYRRRLPFRSVRSVAVTVDGGTIHGTPERPCAVLVPKFRECESIGNGVKSAGKARGTTPDSHQPHDKAANDTVAHNRSSGIL